MTAECTRTKLRFQGLDGRDVVGRFDGGEITSDAGGVLLREVEQRTRILGRLSECFTDYRDSDRVEHPVEALIKQRVLGLCLGYEDLNDHDELCRDRLLALLCDRDDLTGEFRRVESDRGKPLAGKSTLNRLERTPLEGPEGAYKKIVADPAGMDEAAAGGVCGSASGAPGGGDPGCRRHGRSAAWEAGRTVLPRLLQTLLLPATVRLLWGTPACVRGCARRIEARPTGWWRSWNRS